MVDDRFPLYTIRDRKGQSIIHHDRLKKCNDRDIPIWLRRLRHDFHNDTSFNDTKEDPDETIPYCKGKAMRNPDLFRQVSLQSEFEQLFPDNKVSRNLKTKGPVALDCDDESTILTQYPDLDNQHGQPILSVTNKPTDLVTGRNSARQGTQSSIACQDINPNVSIVVESDRGVQDQEGPCTRSGRLVKRPAWRADYE